MPIDKFTLEKVIEEEEELLSYVEQIAKQYCPDIGFDSQNQPHQLDTADNSIYKFMDRYNANKIAKFTYNNYIKHTEIQGSLEGMGVHSEKFWYLLLFIFDYTKYCSWDGLYLALSPKEELQKLVEILDKEAKSTESPQITIKKGKKSFVIENEDTIKCIVELSKLAISNTEEGSIMYLHLADKDKKINESLAIWIFASMFFDFFKESKDKFNSRQNKECDFSFSKNLLISRLIYFTRLSINESYDVSADNLKDVLKKYKDKSIPAINNIYF